MRDLEGNDVGSVLDVVVNWDGGYPPLTGLVVKVGPRRTWVHSQDVESISQREVRLRRTVFDLRDVVRRPGELHLVRDVLDHQLVDVDGVRVVRASDLYLARQTTGVRLVGVDASVMSFLRRVLPGRTARQPTPGQVLDWSSIQPFGVPGEPVRLSRSHAGLQRLRPAELADLLEDLGRPERRELLEALDPSAAADALEEMSAEHLEDLLRDAPVEQAAGLLESMEPDEAVDALRDLPDAERDTLLAAMGDERRTVLTGLLDFPEGTAGGFMTTSPICTQDDTVGDAVALLRGRDSDGHDVSGVVIVDAEGRLLDDVAVFELVGVPPETAMRELVGPPWPTTVPADADLDEVVRQLIDNRRGSLVVVDEDEQPLGRILADDVLDALVASGDRHWPWQRRVTS